MNPEKYVQYTPIRKTDLTLYLETYIHPQVPMP